MATVDLGANTPGWFGRAVVRRRGFPWLVVIACIGYAVGSHVAFLWFAADGLGPTFFPSAGLILGMLVLLPKRHWPAVLSGAALAEFGLDLIHNISGTLALAYVAANLLEPLVGALLIRSRVDRVDLRRLRDLLLFMVCGVVIAPFVGGVVGATGSLALDGGIGWMHFATHWWVGDGLGILVVGGTILAWHLRPTTRTGASYGIEVAAAAAAVAVLTLIDGEIRSLLLVYLVIGLLGLAAFRLGTTGVAIVGAALSFALATVAANSSDAFGAMVSASAFSLVYLQISVALILVAALAIAASLYEQSLEAIARIDEHAHRARAEADAAREREIAMTLQRSLLGPATFHTDEVSIRCFYRAGVSEMHVGGDWHDVLALDGGRIAASVGDVVGRGLAAASTMGRLRVALSVIALEDRSPHEVIEQLDTFATTVEGAALATLVFCVLDVGSGAFTYAAAGHPPPLVVDARGDARFLWDGRSRPIRAPVPGARTDGRTTLDVGDTLILFTDGLIERSGESLDVGLERLRAVARGSHERSPRQIAGDIATRLRAENARGDDVVLMVVRRRLPGERVFARTVQADQHAIRPLRADIGAWLETVGIDRETRDVIVLCVWEALTNAVEHGSLPGDTVDLSLTAHRDGELVVEVCDQGRQRPHTAERYRGYGIVLMRSLMDDVALTNDDLGSTTRLRLSPVSAEVS